MTDVEVAGIEVRCRQRLQVPFFFLEAGRRRLPELAKLTLIRDLGKPLLQQLVKGDRKDSLIFGNKPKGYIKNSGYNALMTIPFAPPVERGQK